MSSNLQKHYQLSDCFFMFYNTSTVVAKIAFICFYPCFYPPDTHFFSL